MCSRSDRLLFLLLVTAQPEVVFTYFISCYSLATIEITLTGLISQNRILLKLEMSAFEF